MSRFDSVKFYVMQLCFRRKLDEVILFPFRVKVFDWYTPSRKVKMVVVGDRLIPFMSKNTTTCVSKLATGSNGPHEIEEIQCSSLPLPMVLRVLHRPSSERSCAMPMLLNRRSRHRIAH